MFACLRKSVAPWQLFEEGRKSFKEFSAKDQEGIVTEYLPKVRYLAQLLKKRLPASMEYNELFNAGVLGLLDALNKYDPTSQNSFSTYAENRINGAMKDELRSRDPLSRGSRTLVKLLSSAQDNFERQHGRMPSEADLAKMCKLSIDEVRRGLTAMEQQMGTQDMYQLAETLTNDGLGSGGTPCNDAIRDEVVMHIRTCLAELNEREQFILSMSYVEECSLKEIASALKVSEGRVSQLRAQAIRHLSDRYMRRYGR